MTDPRPVSDAQRLAEACAEAMHARDWCAQAHEIRLAEVRPGYARMTMPVRKDMVNGHDICHGGMIFTLADTAFAYACNGRNQATVASGCTIDFAAPGRLGDTLTAAAEERVLAGRTGVYDVAVSNQDGTLIALFRGNSYRIKGEVLPGQEIES
ncbi:acyl-CoA thioesterase [Plasticicumulans lactativorans]|uniref:Acyl-CoA thioesterase n=1 Tax=Plasticicumulans lactativorans TaxID=1133106 RepID=A0A4R2LP54_9GAMM|nr:hydroxyphenylacetyl-CoA thioesterase PaaI [Plasticicumulans lactativorans]TCO81258.1 acyl-CoA thioesterase [Plasticicumulans lactativorans]